MSEPGPTNDILHRDTNYEAHPERYPLDMDDEQALDVAPYASRIVPFWRYRSTAEASTSAAQLYELYTRYKEANDFVGMDVVRRLLRLGLKYARNLAPDPALPPNAPLQPTPAAIFSKTFRMVDNDPDFASMRQTHAERHSAP